VRYIQIIFKLNQKHFTYLLTIIEYRIEEDLQKHVRSRIAIYDTPQDGERAYGIF